MSALEYLVSEKDRSTLPNKTRQVLKKGQDYYKQKMASQ